VALDGSIRLMDFGLSKLVDFTRAASNMTSSIGKRKTNAILTNFFLVDIQEQISTWRQSFR